MITQLNWVDIALNRKLRQAGSPRSLSADAAVGDGYLGRVILKQKSELVGWLCNPAREFIAEVENFDGDRIVTSIPADRYNDHAKKRGYSRMGF